VGILLVKRCCSVYRLADLALLVEGELLGNAHSEIKGAASLEDAGPGDITFAAEHKHLGDARTTRATAVIVPRDFPDVGKAVIRVASPRLAWAVVLEAFAPPVEIPLGIHDTAVIGEDVMLGSDVSIQAYCFVGARTRVGSNVVLYPGVYIGEDVTIGDHTIIYPNAVIRERVKVGKGCIIHAGAVLGSDGFGFVTTSAGHRKVEHIGTVVVEDDVEIGANTTIDRATTGVTLVGAGSKIDNLVQLGHNVQIGPACLLVALSGVAGSAVLGRGVTLAGQSGVAGHLTIGEGCVVASRGLVAKDTPARSFVSGFPARPHKENMRILAAEQRLPELLKDVAQLKRQVEEMAAREADIRARLQETEQELERMARRGEGT
jgi:UDP-3-O-[3-hydroxymyristoyl] glucosamine N-acyltransferase